MRILVHALSAALVVALVALPQPASAAPIAAPHRSVGTRIDTPLGPSKSQAASRLPYLVPDQAAFARAKNAAAARANGPASYARSDFAVSATPPSQTVVQGSTTTFTVNTQVTAGTARPVALSVTGLPAGATDTFNPASVQAGNSSVLTVATTSSTATGTFTLTIRGDYTSPPTTHTTTVSLTVAPLPPPDEFSLAATPSSQGVVQGAGASYNVTTQVTSGNAQTVTFSLAGLPAGASGTFTPPSVTAGGTSTLGVTTSTSTPVGTFTLTITATGPSATHATSVTLTVSAPVPNDFSLSAAPASQSVVQGGSATYTVTTQVTSGNAEPVTFSLAGLPADATGTFSPPSVTAGGSSTLTVSTAATTPAGTSTLTITGTASSATHSSNTTLVVSAPVPNDFSISATPATQTVVQGASTTYDIGTQLASGSAETVTFSVSGLPAGATGTFAPPSVTAGGTATLTVATSATTPAGTSTLTITGASPSATHSTTVTLVVNPVPDDFSISASPASASVVQGSSANYTVSTAVVSGNAQTVTFSVSGLSAGATGTFNPGSVAAGGSSTLTVTTTTTAATGTFTVVITGTYPSSTTHSTSVSLTVTPLPPPDEFSISATPSLRTVTQGGSTTYTVATQVTSGNAQSVSLSVSGLPMGATGTFAPPTVTAGASSVLTVATTTATPVASYTLTVTGQGAAGPTHSTTVTLEVTSPASGPTIGMSWNGQFETDLAPPDPTGAMGANSFIQVTNLRYGIYGRDSRLIQEGDLGMLTRFPVTELTDPQIVWDPTSQRFYYLVLDYNNNAFAFGYSKTANPQSDDEFCHYIITAFYYNTWSTPDYPKLAVTRDFVLIGSNVFLLLSFYMGSDVNWFVKPTDSVCPSQLGMGGTFQALKNADGSDTSTPEPAVALDAISGGWIVGSNDVSTSGGADYLSVFKVTKNAQGQAQLSAAMPVTVPHYQMPANAPQSGTNQLLDTMDTRLTHAVAGYDPRIDGTAIWTAHTVFGGAGAEVRWFEITTLGTPQLTQNGVVTDPELYVFNGAISSDRAADDGTGAAAVTGQNMVMGFNTSSSSTFSAIKMVSQRGAGPQSGSVVVKQSVGHYVDFACGSSVPNVCRWGDYGGAYADPLVSNGGQVWLSSEWNEPATDGSTPTWRTWNWSARP